MQISHWLLAAGLVQASTANIIPRDVTEPASKSSRLEVRAQCPTAQLLVARGTHQEPGEGSMAPLAATIVRQVPGSRSVALKYPASLEPTYERSVGTGAEHMTNYIHNFTAKCPSSKLVLLGYSQGAQVTMDTLCGNADAFNYNYSRPMSSKYMEHISAVVLWGDPTRQSTEPWNRGTSKVDGKFPRDPASCSEWVGQNKIRSYCDVGDPYCAMGHRQKVHGEYGGKYRNISAAFVVKKVNGTQL